jgi:hypothetical protein
MPRIELFESLAMILIILLWWPLLFMGYDWPVYRQVLEVGSIVTLVAIFVRRLRTMNRGFVESEKMMQARFDAEKAMRGGDPSLDDRPVPPARRRSAWAPGGGNSKVDDAEDKTCEQKPEDGPIG